MKIVKNRFISLILLFFICFNIVLSAIPSVVYAVVIPMYDLNEVTSKLAPRPSQGITVNAGSDFAALASKFAWLGKLNDFYLVFEALRLGGWSVIDNDGFSAKMMEGMAVAQQTGALTGDKILHVNQQFKDWINGVGSSPAFDYSLMEGANLPLTDTQWGKYLSMSDRAYFKDMPYDKDWSFTLPIAFVNGPGQLTGFSVKEDSTNFTGSSFLDIAFDASLYSEGTYFKVRYFWDSASKTITSNVFGYSPEGVYRGICGTFTRDFSAFSAPSNNICYSSLNGLYLSGFGEGKVINNCDLLFRPESVSKTNTDNLVVGSDISFDGISGNYADGITESDYVNYSVSTPPAITPFNLNISNHDTGLMAYTALSLGANFSNINDFNLFMYQFKNYLDNNGVSLSNDILYDDKFKSLMVDFKSSFNSLAKPSVAPLVTTTSVNANSSVALNCPYVDASTTVIGNKVYFPLDVSPNATSTCNFSYNIDWKNSAGTVTNAQWSSNNIPFVSGFKYRFYFIRTSSTTWTSGYCKIDSLGNMTDMGTVQTSTLPDLVSFKVKSASCYSTASQMIVYTPQIPTYVNDVLASWNPAHIATGKFVGAEGIKPLTDATGVNQSYIIKGNIYSKVVPDVNGLPVSKPIVDTGIAWLDTLINGLGNLFNGLFNGVSTLLSNILNTIGNLVSSFAEMLKSLFIPSTLSFPLNLQDNLFGQFISFLDFSSLFSVTPTPFQFDVDFNALSFGGNNLDSTHYSLSDVSILNDNIGTVRNFTSLTILVFTVIGIFKRILPQRTMD